MIRRRTLLALSLCLFTGGAAAQVLETVSTLCQAATVQVVEDIVDRRLVGCGEGFPDNLLWHLDRSDSASGALDQTMRRRFTGKGALVYVLDVGGIKRDHVEFQRATGSNVIDGFNSNGQRGTGCNDALAPCATSRFQLLIDGHGTAVASIIAGKTVGVAPDASLVAVRVFENGDAGWERALKTIITHAFAPTTPQVRTAIISMSSVPAFDASPRFEALMRKMIDGVDAQGNADPNGKRFLFVVFGGNSGDLVGGRFLHCRTVGGETALFPSILGSQLDGLIAVGGLTRENQPWSGACFGTFLDVLAPAADVVTASSGGVDHYRFLPALVQSGTSYSTPYVAGMAARLLEIDPTLTPQELERRLKGSASFVDGLPVPVMLVAGKRRSVR